MSNSVPLSSGINQGSAQVFSQDAANSAIAFARQQKLQQNQMDYVDRKQKEKETAAELAKTLASFSDRQGWPEHQKYNDKLLNDGTKIRQEIIDNIDKFKDDPRYRIEVENKVAQYKAESEAQKALKGQYSTVAKLVITEPNKFSEEKKDRIKRIGRGELTIDEAMEEDPNWNWPDLGPSALELGEGYWKNVAKDMVSEMAPSGVKPIGGGKGVVMTQDDVEASKESMRRAINSDPTWLKQIIVEADAKRMQGMEIPEGKEVDLWVDDFVNLKRKTKYDTVVIPQGPSGGGDEEEIPQIDLERAQRFVADLESAVATNDPKKIESYLAAAGIEAKAQPDGKFKFTYSEGLKDGMVEKRTYIFDPASDDYFQFFDFVTSKNESLSYAALKAVQQPQLAPPDLSGIEAQANDLITALVGNKPSSSDLKALRAIPGVSPVESSFFGGWMGETYNQKIVIDGTEYSLKDDEEKQTAIDLIKEKIKKQKLEQNVTISPRNTVPAKTAPANSTDYRTKYNY